MTTPGSEPHETSEGDDAGARSRGINFIRANFISSIVQADLASGKHQQIVTRFPPEPNGYLHIGHAKAICLGHGLARDHGGVFRLRFDDTNPANEDVEYVNSIQEDVRWLGCEWDGEVRFASEYFEQMYTWATDLIRAGLAYVDSLTKDEIREYRGTVTEPGRESPYRRRSVEENLDLFARMRAGEFADGAHVLRAKIDMASPNMLMRDPLLYRILRATHHRTGDDWCIYPMYDYAHCLEDAIEGVTHSLCTLEFEINREIYDWLIGNLDVPHTPRQIEFARLALSYTVLSKRYFLRLVNEGLVSGWDDPRMPTLAGLRRRGVTPEALHAFCDMIGVAKTNSTVDLGKFEYCLRTDLSHRSPRVQAVLRPLEVVITNYPEDRVEMIDAPYWPHDVPKEGSRELPFSRVLYVEREDFREDAPKKWHRLAPGREVRLRYAYVIRCDEVIRDEESGEIVRLLCSYDAATRHGNPEGRKVRGTIHWVSAAHALPAEVRLYDRLFLTERPGAVEGVDMLDELNPDSLTTLTGCRVEPSLSSAAPGGRYQFERQGYFIADSEDSSPDALVFNRVVTLRDSWAKLERKTAGAASTSKKTAAKPAAASESAAATPPPPTSTVADERRAARAADPVLAAAYARMTEELGLDEPDADRLTGARDVAEFFAAAHGAHGEARSIANWMVNELGGSLGDRTLADLPLGGAQFGALVGLVDTRTVTGAGGKRLLAHMLEHGGDPSMLVDELGLRALDSDDEIVAAVDAAIAANPDNAARYRAGKTGLIGFFMGAVMKATRGKADPVRTKELLLDKLG